MRRAILNLLFPVLIILGLAVISFAQDATKTNERPQPPAQSPQRREENRHQPDAARYSWEFKHPASLVSHILIEHDALCRVKITLEQKGEDTPIVELFELPTCTPARIFVS